MGILYTVLASLNDNLSSPSAVTAAIAAFDFSASVGGALTPSFLQNIRIKIRQRTIKMINMYNYC
jgi:hypothetical protein